MLLEPELQHVIDRLKAHFEREGWLLDLDPVQHGIKLTLDAGGPTATGTLYFSKKKGRFSWVPNGKGDAAMASQLADAIHERIGNTNAASSNGKSSKHAAGSSELKLKVWIGTDETGKGDLFGPLVAAGFIADTDIAPELAKLGVRDSKELNRTAIDRIAGELQKRYPDRIAVVEVGPKRYNEIYPDFETRGGINGVLGWAHAKAIAELAVSKYQPTAAVVDRFSPRDRVKSQLPTEIKIRVIERPGGESNLAVAAAAILARSRFEKALDRMGEVLGWRPHPGAGGPSNKDLDRLIRVRKPEISSFVKMHFAPVKSRGLIR